MEEESKVLLNAIKRTHEMFIGNVGAKIETTPDIAEATKVCKQRAEYAAYVDPHKHINEKQHALILRRLGLGLDLDLDVSSASGLKPKSQQEAEVQGEPQEKRTSSEEIKSPVTSKAKIEEPADLGAERKVLGVSGKTETALKEAKETSAGERRLAGVEEAKQRHEASNLSLVSILSKVQNQVAIKPRKEIKPQWHKPWKLMRVISGHKGWVRCLAMDPLNTFFVSGSNDRTIKFWDLASGQLKLTLTGHINTIRGLAVSGRHPYLFSCAEDKNVYCWDLEQNKVIRKYHGHLSGVYCLALHPVLDVIITGGRDATTRVWDIRTKSNVHVLDGHTDTVGSVLTQEFEPQVISGGYDSMIKLWDIGTGKCMQTLTQHKKGVRSMVMHSQEYTFASAGADKVRVWKCPEGLPLRTIAGHNAIINSMALNTDNVLATCADNGTMYFWDWASGYNFQQLKTIPQPGSLSCEAGIYAAMFDQSSLRFITAECDKTIKIWKEDDTATPESFPISLTNLAHHH